MPKPWQMRSLGGERRRQAHKGGGETQPAHKGKQEGAVQQKGTGNQTRKQPKQRTHIPPARLEVVHVKRAQYHQ